MSNRFAYCIYLCMFHLFVLLDLHHFLTLVTGTPYLTSKGISVDLITDYDPPVAIHTCAQSIILSTMIECLQRLSVELDVLLHDQSFTMA